MDKSFKTDQKKITANVKAGGCAAKLGSHELESILSKLPTIQSPQLITGISGFEDAAVYKISDDLAIVQTIDFFPPLLDDPYIFGQIAAANALSDVYAMGGKPIICLNVLCFPTCDYPLSVVEEILKGGADKVNEAGASLAGGHSIQISEPVYGLAVTGLVDPSKVLTNGGAKKNDAIILTKEIGTGVALLGLKAEEIESSTKEKLISNLTTLNQSALEATEKYTVNAMTDITGFGLCGHIHEMAKSSGLKARLEINRINFLPQVKSLASQGFVPAGAYGNRQSFEEILSIKKELDLELQDLLFDPQTSGGLLISVAEEDVSNLLKELEERQIIASCIGKFEEPLADEKAGQVFVD